MRVPQCHTVGIRVIVKNRVIVGVAYAGRKRPAYSGTGTNEMSTCHRFLNDLSYLCYQLRTTVEIGWKSFGTDAANVKFSRRMTGKTCDAATGVPTSAYGIQSKHVPIFGDECFPDLSERLFEHVQPKSLITSSGAEGNLTVGDQGLWLNVLEQAFGQVRKALMPKTRGMPELDAISLGGSPCPASHALPVMPAVDSPFAASVPGLSHLISRGALDSWHKCETSFG